MTVIEQRGQTTTTSSAPTNAPARAPLRINLFLKYVALVVAVVLIALLTNGAFDVWFSYQEYKGSLIRIQREQAEAAAAKIGQFIHEIEAQVGWTTQLPWSASTLEQRRFDASRLLRQVPAITELSQIDATGHEQLRVSRLAMDVVGSETDYSHDPKFTEAVAHKVYYGPVYFRRESEPYMTLSLAGTHPKRRRVGCGGEPQADLGRGLADQGRRARPRVCRRRPRAADRPPGHQPGLAQHRPVSARPGAGSTRASRRQESEQVQEADDIQTRRCSPRMRRSRRSAGSCSSSCRSKKPMRRFMRPSAFGHDPARRFAARPRRRPRPGTQDGRADPGAARRRGTDRRGDLGQRISIRTGDELEGLADQFNDMAGQLQESYADLERKVEDRTEQLAQSVEELRALGEVRQAVNSTLDLKTVLDTIVTKATQLSGTEAGAIYVLTRAARISVTCHLRHERRTDRRDGKTAATISDAVGRCRRAEPEQIPICGTASARSTR